MRISKQTQQPTDEVEHVDISYNNETALLIQLALLSPLILILMMEYITHHFLTLICFYICVSLMFFPWLIMEILNLDFNSFFIGCLHEIEKQTKHGFVYFYLMFFSVICLYFMVNSKNVNQININQEHNEKQIISSLLIYSFVLPIFEEWFWRLFIPKLINPRKTLLLYLYISIYYAAISSVLLYKLNFEVIHYAAIGVIFLVFHSILQAIHTVEGALSSLIAQIGLNIAITIIVIDLIKHNK